MTELLKKGTAASDFFPRVVQVASGIFVSIHHAKRTAVQPCVLKGKVHAQHWLLPDETISKVFYESLLDVKLVKVYQPSCKNISI